MIVISPKTPTHSHCSLVNEYKVFKWPKQTQIMKQATVMKSDLIVALKTLPI